MGTIKSNTSFKENPITSILGLFFCIIASVVFIAPMFMETVDEIQWYIPCGIGVVGILLLLSPDTLVGIIKSKSEKV